jgi:drug/metabolite transporter (DMT)-like permease
MVLAVSTFTCIDAVAKSLTAHYAVPAIVWARYFFQFVLMVAFLGPRMGLGLVRTRHLGLQILRGLILTAGSLVFFTALKHIPLADASSITFLSPILVALLAGPLLGEKVSPRMWLAMGAGFTGVLLIIRPGTAAFTWYYLLPLGNAFFLAAYQILTRKLAGHENNFTTLFYPALVGSIGLTIAFPPPLVVPSIEPLHAALFVVLGAGGTVGHFLLIRAHDLAPASLLAPFSYTQLLTAIFLGWLVFGNLPDGIALAGMLLVVASGLVLILSHRSKA